MCDEIMKIDLNNEFRQFVCNDLHKYFPKGEELRY